MNILTFDIDWAPEKVIEDVINLLSTYNIKATFFATHESEILKKIEKEGIHEMGIHPNFNPLLLGQGGNYQKKIDDLLKIYPSAVGFRAHSLTHSCPILLYCLEKGIKYDSNIYIPFGKELKAFNYFGLMRIPYNWEDDGQWVSGKSFSDIGLKLDAELNIFSFHPIHVYLNTYDQAMYDNVKQFYQMPDELLKNRNKSIPGTRDLLLFLLKKFAEDGSRVPTLKEYYNHIKEDIE
ncbi:MAG TPA: polysaccharide deacetylase family protein [Bacteroidia bacterium]|jgi:hypothetical protein|nr:polysaccharide deacetylase family protein [Bacteroidia bacterium]